VNRQEAEVAGGGAMSAPLTGTEQQVLWLLRGASYTIGELALHVRVSRREIEEAVESLRLAGEPIVGGNDGLTLTADADVLARYLEARRRRTAHIHRGTLKLRTTLRRMQERSALTLWEDVA